MNATAYLKKQLERDLAEKVKAYREMLTRLKLDAEMSLRRLDERNEVDSLRLNVGARAVDVAVAAANVEQAQRTLSELRGAVSMAGEMAEK